MKSERLKCNRRIILSKDDERKRRGREVKKKNENRAEGSDTNSTEARLEY